MSEEAMQTSEYDTSESSPSSESSDSDNRRKSTPPSTSKKQRRNKPSPTNWKLTEEQQANIENLIQEERKKPQEKREWNYIKCNELNCGNWWRLPIESNELSHLFHSADSSYKKHIKKHKKKNKAAAKQPTTQVSSQSFFQPNNLNFPAMLFNPATASLAVMNLNTTTTTSSSSTSNVPSSMLNVTTPTSGSSTDIQQRSTSLKRSRKSSHMQPASMQPASMQPASMQSASLQPASYSGIINTSLQTIIIKSIISSDTCVIYCDPIRKELIEAGIVKFKCGVFSQNAIINGVINFSFFTRQNVTTWNMPLVPLNRNINSPVVSQERFDKIVITNFSTPAEFFQKIADPQDYSATVSYAKDIELGLKQDRSRSAGDKLYSEVTKPLELKQCNPYILDRFNDVNKSLSTLAFYTSGEFVNQQILVRGFIDSYGYLKWNDAFFCIHAEQIAAPFVHHQAFGKSIWYYILNRYRAELMNVLREYCIESFLRESGFNKPSREDVNYTRLGLQGGFLSLLDLYIYAKRVMPTPKYLRDHGIPVNEVLLEEDTYLYANGNIMHFGLNASYQGVGIAINCLPESWLDYGLPFICEITDHIARQSSAIRNLRNNDSVIQLGVKLLFQPLYDRNSVVFSDYLNTIPYEFTCGLLQGIIRDLNFYVSSTKVNRNDDCKFEWSESMTVDRAKGFITTAEKGLKQLHRIRNIFAPYSKSYGPICSCDLSKETDILPPL